MEQKMLFIERKELLKECDDFIGMVGECGLEIPKPQTDDERINLLRTKIALKEKIIKEYGKELREQFSRYTLWMLVICVLGYLSVVTH